MKYDEEIEREIRLEEQDFVDLFRKQEAVDGGTRLHIKKLDFLRALGRLDPMAQLTEEEREELKEKHATPHSPEIEVKEMDGEFGEDTRIFGNPDEKSREEIVEKAIDWMSHGGEYSLREARQEYGDWFVEALNEDERLNFHEGYKTWARSDL